MSAQGVNITVADGQLGLSPPGQGPTMLVIGCSSGSTVTSFVPYTATNPNTFKTNSGTGPGPSLAAFIANQTGNPVMFVKVPNQSNGTITAFFATVGNAGTAAIVASGTPNDDYLIVVKYGATGAFGSATIPVSISIDGGKTYPYINNLVGTTTIAGGTAFTADTGLSLTFSGSPTNGDSHYAVGTAPTWSAAAVQSALNAAAAIKSVTFQDAVVAGVSAAADATAFDGYMATLANSKRFARLLCSARDAVWGGASTETETAWMTSTITAFANNATPRVSVSAGYYPFIDPFTSSQLRRSILWGAGARDSAVPISVDLGQVGGTNGGSISNVVLPTSPDTFGNGTLIYHDESQNPGFDAARFLSCWQLVGLPGIYIMNPNLMAAPGSDFKWLQLGHVIDVACTIAYQYFVQQVSTPIRVSTKTGFILPQEQARLQNGCNAQLANQLVTPGFVSGANCVVSGTDNILSTATLTVTISVVPLGYAKAINVTVTFLNPATVQVQQAAQ